MQNEFDKEIDALLRKAVTGDNAGIPATGHLDADEISMFAENALAGGAKDRAVSHMADCGRCREILVNVVALNEEEGVDLLPAAAPVAAAVVESTPEPSWFAGLFSTRNLAIAFGGLALVFAGFLGFTALNANLENQQLAQADKEATNTATRPQERRPAEPPKTESLDETADSKADDMDSVPELGDYEKSRQTGRDIAEPKKEATPRIDPGASRKEVTEAPNEFIMKRRGNTSPKVTEEEADTVATPLSDARTKDDAKTEAPPPKPVVGASKPVLTTRGSRDSDSRERADKKANKQAAKVAPRKPAPVVENQVAARRVVSGKTFIKRDNGWYDVAYKNQRPTVVVRGTTAYGNLDSGLRTIGNRIPGTIFVIWKNKAYKIQ